MPWYGLRGGLLQEGFDRLVKPGPSRRVRAGRSRSRWVTAVPESARPSGQGDVRPLLQQSFDLQVLVKLRPARGSRRASAGFSGGAFTAATAVRAGHGCHGQSQRQQQCVDLLVKLGPAEARFRSSRAVAAATAGHGEEGDVCPQSHNPKLHEISGNIVMPR